MPDYENGKIYKLTCAETCKVYIGSTTLALPRRLSGHKSITSTNITRNFINPKIELIELYPCKTKQDLLWKEREWMEKTDCINQFLPIMTKDEKRIYQKNWERDNYKKIAISKQKKITCECGSSFSRSNKSQHLKTKKHLNFLKN